MFEGKRKVDNGQWTVESGGGPPRCPLSTVNCPLFSPSLAIGGHSVNRRSERARNRPPDRCVKRGPAGFSCGRLVFLAPSDLWSKGTMAQFQDIMATAPAILLQG